MSIQVIRPKRRIVINPFTGQLDYVSDNNFSYEYIPVNSKLVVNPSNQMAVFDEFLLDGDLDLYGSLILEE